MWEADSFKTLTKQPYGKKTMVKGKRVQRAFTPPYEYITWNLWDDVNQYDEVTSRK